MTHGAEVREPGPAAGSPRTAAGEGEEQAWRQEVASRVRSHRARRRANADPNALELDFTSEEPYSFAGPQENRLPPPPQRFAEIMMKAEAKKVIRFPRPAVAPPPAVEEIRMDELSSMPMESPRIMEAPPGEEDFMTAAHAEQFLNALPAEQAPVVAEAEQMELLPSFADIHLEPEASRLGDDEAIPHPAPLSQRAVAGLVDGAIVLIASGVFAVTFLQMAEEMPQSRLTMVCALAAGGIFWLVFQYLFLVHGRGTPGMRFAQLELRTFEGQPPSLFARRCRALASTLSAFAAGLGYLWAFIDEDRVGWQDRITQTYLGSLHVPSEAREPYIRDNLTR